MATKQHSPKPVGSGTVATVSNVSMEKSLPGSVAKSKTSEIESTEVKSTPEKLAKSTVATPRLLVDGTVTKLVAELPPEVTMIERTLLNGVGASEETKSRANDELWPPDVKSTTGKSS